MTATWTTYHDTEAITWQRVNGIAIAVRIERDRAAVIRDDDRIHSCPRCGAPAGRPCISPAGNALTKAHVARTTTTKEPL